MIEVNTTCEKEKKSNFLSLLAGTDGKGGGFHLICRAALDSLSEFNQASHSHSCNSVPVLIYNFVSFSLDKLKDSAKGPCLSTGFLF